jgi:hypothetical protein
MVGTIFSFMLVGDAVLVLLMGIDMSKTLSTLRARLGEEMRKHIVQVGRLTWEVDFIRRGAYKLLADFPIHSFLMT